jgi:hypothetical protein
MKLVQRNIDFWLHPSKLGTNEPTLCLHHSTAEIGQTIFDSLARLGGTNDNTCTITFDRCRRERALATLTISLVAPQDELQVMNIACVGEQATITVTAAGLTLLRDAVAQWLAGAEDFGVSPCRVRNRKHLGSLDRESGELWFWGPHYSAP